MTTGIGKSLLRKVLFRHIQIFHIGVFCPSDKHQQERNCCLCEVVRYTLTFYDKESKQGQFYRLDPDHGFSMDTGYFLKNVYTPYLMSTGSLKSY